MREYNFDDLLKEKLKNPKFKKSFYEERRRLENLTVTDSKVKNYDFKQADKIKREYM